MLWSLSAVALAFSSSHEQYSFPCHPHLSLLLICLLSSCPYSHCTPLFTGLLTSTLLGVKGCIASSVRKHMYIDMYRLQVSHGREQQRCSNGRTLAHSISHTVCRKVSWCTLIVPLTGFPPSLSVYWALFCLPGRNDLPPWRRCTLLASLSFWHRTATVIEQANVIDLTSGAEWLMMVIASEETLPNSSWTKSVSFLSLHSSTLLRKDGCWLAATRLSATSTTSRWGWPWHEKL